jgi:hypothetical protein
MRNTSAVLIRLLSTGFAIAAALLASVTVALPTYASGSGRSAVPFSDPQQSGLITLCNKHGEMVSSGSTLSVPFVWKAVSSAPAPVVYRKRGLETLLAYQPIRYVAPGDWSGEQLTGATRFTNGLHPAAAAVPTDSPLVSFTGGFPPHWDGLVQLRMYLTGPNMPEYATKYPTAVIRVSGTHWTLLEGNQAPCSAGGGTSIDYTVLSRSQVNGKAGSSGSTARLGKGNRRGSAAPFAAKGGGSSSSGGSAASAQGASPVASSSRAGGGGSESTLLITLIVLLVLTVAAGFYALRRRPPASTQS